MTDMIEKIARAIWRHHWRDPHPDILPPENCGPAQDDWRTNKEYYSEQALAALTALEQPSDEMVQTGITYRLAVEKPNVHDTAGIFSAMIKAARGDQ